MPKFEKRISVDGEKASRRAEMDRAAEELKNFLKEAIERAEKLKEFWKKEFEESRAWLKKRIEIGLDSDSHLSAMDKLSAEYASVQMEIVEHEIWRLRESYKHLEQSGFFAPFVFDAAVEEARKKGVFVDSPDELPKH